MSNCTYTVIYDSGNYQYISFDDALWLCGILNFFRLNAVIVDRHGNYVN